MAGTLLTKSSSVLSRATSLGAGPWGVDVDALEAERALATAHLATAQSSAANGKLNGAGGVEATQGQQQPDHAGDVKLVLQRPQQEPLSIYDEYGPKQRWAILAAVSVTAIIVPLTDTIYIPGMAQMVEELNTSQQLIAASVAVYFAALGISALFWGPASDRFGRKAVYLFTIVSFIGTTLGCIFSPDATTFVICRMLQGLAVPPFTTNSTAVVADVFHPRQRGTAMGLRSLPLLVGPVLGPVVGGVMCQTWGWRSTFMLLAGLAGVIAAPMLIFLVPETHQHMVLARIAKTDPDRANRIAEAPLIRACPPSFRQPFLPLAAIFTPASIPHALISVMSFGSWFAMIGEMSIALSHPPYSMSEAIIGVCFLPMGVAGMIASPLGGWMADRASAAAPHKHFARLKWGNMLTLCVMPAGLVLFGWSLHLGWNLAAPFMATILASMASFGYMPCYFSWLANNNQSAAASVTGAAQALLFLMAGAMFQCAALGVAALGLARFFTILAATQATLSLIALGQFILLDRGSAAGQDGGQRHC